MGVIESALAWIQDIADDDSHGYDQSNRWGKDYDCSSLVISAYKKAGVNLSCTYTGNMYSDMVAKGFKDVTNTINLSSGAGLVPGDVLLNHTSHTAMYIGIGKVAQASSNENGGVTGGQSGDQTGREISKSCDYYNFPWNAVLRYSESNEEAKESSNTGEYTVKSGDSLWGIAAKLLGDGCRYGEIISVNNLKSDRILPGTVLKIPAKKETETKVFKQSKCNVTLPEYCVGSSGIGVKTLQNALRFRGCSCSETGSFDSKTKNAVIMFQQSAGVSSDGVVGQNTWEALFS